MDVKARTVPRLSERLLVMCASSMEPFQPGGFGVVTYMTLCHKHSVQKLCISSNVTEGIIYIGTNTFWSGRFLAHGIFIGGSRIRVRRQTREAKRIRDSRAMRTQGRKAITFLVITSCAAPCVLTPSRTFDTIVSVPAINVYRQIVNLKEKEKDSQRIKVQPNQVCD